MVTIAIVVAAEQSAARWSVERRQEAVEAPRVKTSTGGLSEDVRIRGRNVSSGDRTRAQAGRYNVRISPVELVYPDLRPAPPHIVSMNDKKHSKNKRLLSVAPMMDWTDKLVFMRVTAALSVISP